MSMDIYEPQKVEAFKAIDGSLFENRELCESRNETILNMRKVAVRYDELTKLFATLGMRANPDVTKTLARNWNQLKIAIETADARIH